VISTKLVDVETGAQPLIHVTIFEEAVDMDHVLKNPARKILLPECRSTRRLTLAPELLRKLFAAIVDPRDRLLLLIATFCAMRTSEVLGLTWTSY
jgi:integrase